MEIHKSFNVYFHDSNDVRLNDFIQFDEKEREILIPLFEIFNEKFDLMLGDYEDDAIERQNIKSAIEITEEIIGKIEDKNIINTYKKFLEALKKAEKNNYYVWIDL